jgi:hypothetical protein
MRGHQRRDFLKLAAAGVIAPPLLNDPASNAGSGGARAVAISIRPFRLTKALAMLTDVSSVCMICVYVNGCSHIQ